MKPDETALPAPRPLKSSEWVLADLLRRMEDGSFPAGQKLPSVVELGTQYGVGRSTVREALSALKAMGRVTIRQGGGTFVRSPEQPAHPAQLAPELWSDRAASLKGILEVRRVLEAGCAALAASSRQAADIDALQGILSEMELHMEDQAFSEQADVRFHLRIAAATHNAMLVDMMQSLTERLHDSMRDTRALWFYAEKSSAERLLREHRSILDAVIAGDAALARSRMEAHIGKVEQVLHTRS